MEYRNNIDNNVSCDRKSNKRKYSIRITIDTDTNNLLEHADINSYKLGSQVFQAAKSCKTKFNDSIQLLWPCDIIKILKCSDIINNKLSAKQYHNDERYREAKDPLNSNKLICV